MKPHVATVSSGLFEGCHSAIVERLPEFCFTAAVLASSSHRLLSWCEAWPFVQDHLVWCLAFSSSSACQRSWLLTGFLSFVFQPLRFQPAIQLLMPFLTYSESVMI